MFSSDKNFKEPWHITECPPQRGDCDDAFEDLFATFTLNLAVHTSGGHIEWHLYHSSVLLPCFVHKWKPPLAAEELQDTVQMVRFIQTSDLPVRYAGLRSGSTYDIMTTFGIIHTDTIYQLRVRCWCNKQASQICAFIPWRPLQAAIYCCGFCWSIISWIWVLFGCFRRNPLWIHKPSAKDCSHIGCSPEPRDILLWEKEEVRPELSGCVRCPGQISGHIYHVSGIHF